MSPARATESASGYRRYRWKGRELKSVTTILGSGVPKQGPLVGWAAKCVAEAAVAELPKLTRLVAEDAAAEGESDEAVRWLKGAHYRTKKNAGLKGTEIHNLAEAHAKGEPLPPVGAGAAPYVKALMDFLDEYQPEPILTEVTTFNPTEGYAGTLDSVADFAHANLTGRYLLDFKTSKGVYGETAMQLAAYAWAEGWDDGSGELVPMPALDGALVVHISPTGYAIFKADITRPVFDAFLAVKAVAHFTDDLSKHVLQAI